MSQDLDFHNLLDDAPVLSQQNTPEVHDLTSLDESEGKRKARNSGWGMLTKLGLNESRKEQC